MAAFYVAVVTVVAIDYAFVDALSPGVAAEAAAIAAEFAAVFAALASD